MDKGQVVFFEVGGELRGLSVSDLREIVIPEKVTKVVHADERVAGVMSIRGEILAVYRIGEVRGRGRVVVLNERGKTVGLLVDRVIKFGMVEELRDMGGEVLEGVLR